MRPQFLSPPFMRSKTIAATAMGTLMAPMVMPRPWRRRSEMAPPGASRPNTEPPESSTASTPRTVISGSSSVVSRAPGAPPCVTAEATVGVSKTMAVTPLAIRASCAWPTRTPATSVRRLWEDSRDIWAAAVRPGTRGRPSPYNGRAGVASSGNPLVGLRCDDRHHPGQHGPAGIEFCGDTAQDPELGGAQANRWGRVGGRLRWSACAVRAGGAGRAARTCHLDLFDALVAQQALDAFDLVAGVLQEVANGLQQLDVGWPVKAPSAPALHRFDLRELDLPEAQHVLLDAQLLRHFADVAKCFSRLGQGHSPAESRRLFRRIAPDQAGIDALLHDVARPEHQHAPRRDGHFLTGLGIAADPLALLADAEGAEGGKFDGLACCQAARDFAQDQLDQFLGLIAR